MSSIIRFALPPPEVVLLRDCLVTVLTAYSLLKQELEPYVTGIRITYDYDKGLDILEVILRDTSYRDKYLKALSELMPGISRRKPQPQDIVRIFYHDVKYYCEYNYEKRIAKIVFETGTLAGYRIPEDVKKKRLTFYESLAKFFIETVRYWISRSPTVFNLLRKGRPEGSDLSLSYDFNLGDLYVRVAALAPCEPPPYPPHIYTREAKEGHLLLALAKLSIRLKVTKTVLEHLLEFEGERLRIRGAKKRIEEGLVSPLIIRLVRQHPDLGYYIVALACIKAIKQRAIEISAAGDLVIRLHVLRGRDQPWIHTATITGLPEIHRTLEASAQVLGGGVDRLCNNLLRLVERVAQEAESKNILDTGISMLRLFLDSVFRGDPDIEMIYRIERYLGVSVRI